MKSETFVLWYKPKTPIVMYLPFTGSERKCWDCGGNRSIILRFNRQGSLVDWSECCDHGQQ